MEKGGAEEGASPIFAPLIHAPHLRPHYFRCILSKLYGAASDLLSDDIFDVDPHRTATTPTDFFLYCYYGGIAAAGGCLLFLLRDTGCHGVWVDPLAMSLACTFTGFAGKGRI